MISGLRDKDVGGHVCHLRHLEMTSLDITSQTKDDDRILEMETIDLRDDTRQRVIIEILFTRGNPTEDDRIHLLKPFHSTIPTVIRCEICVTA
jgi:hypothetical protein